MSEPCKQEVRITRSEVLLEGVKDSQEKMQDALTTLAEKVSEFVGAQKSAVVASTTRTAILAAAIGACITTVPKIVEAFQYARLDQINP